MSNPPPSPAVSHLPSSHSPEDWSEDPDFHFPVGGTVLIGGGGSGGDGRGATGRDDDDDDGFGGFDEEERGEENQSGGQIVFPATRIDTLSTQKLSTPSASSFSTFHPSGGVVTRLTKKPSRAMVNQLKLQKKQEEDGDEDEDGFDLSGDEAFQVGGRLGTNRPGGRISEQQISQLPPPSSRQETVSQQPKSHFQQLRSKFSQSSLRPNVSTSFNPAPSPFSTLINIPPPPVTSTKRSSSATNTTDGPKLLTRQSIANLNAGPGTGLNTGMNKFQQARLNTRPEGYGSIREVNQAVRFTRGDGGGDGDEWDEEAGFSVGGEGGERGGDVFADGWDEKEETLKASASALVGTLIGAQKRIGSETIRPSLTTAAAAAGGAGETNKLNRANVNKYRDEDNYEDDLEFDFDQDSPGLPLTMNHLRLVNRQHQQRQQATTSSSNSAGISGSNLALQHKSSRSSLISTNTNHGGSTGGSDWDSPTHQQKQQGRGGGSGFSVGRHAVGGRGVPGSPTPSTLTGSHSFGGGGGGGGGITDSSSVTSGGGSELSIKTPNLKSGGSGLLQVKSTQSSSGDDLDDVDDFEDGLEIPSGKLSFFSSGRVGMGELNRLLDRRRKGGVGDGIGIGTEKGREREKDRNVSSVSISSEAVTIQEKDRKPSSSINTAGHGTFKAARPTLSSQAKIQAPTSKSHHRDREEDFEDGLGLDVEEDALGLLNKGRLMNVRRMRAGAGPGSGNGTPTNARQAGSKSGTLQSGTARARTGSRLTSGGKLEMTTTGLPALRVSSGVVGKSELAHADSGIAGHNHASRDGYPPSQLAMIQASPPDGTTTATGTTSSLGVGTPSRLKHQASHSGLRTGGASGSSAPSSAAAMKKKQSMSALTTPVDPFGGQDRPRTPSLVGNKHYVAPTASSVARQQAHKRDREEKEKGDSLGRASSGTGSIGRSVAGGSLGQSVSRPSTPNELSPTSRLTLPTTSSKAKARPAIHSIFPSGESQMVSPPRFQGTSPSHHLSAAAQMLTRPKNVRLYGDGTELDEIDDLAVDRVKEGSMRHPSGETGVRPSNAAGSMMAPTISHRPQLAGEKRKKPSSSSSSHVKPKGRKAAGLIRHLGKMEQKKVGDMTWNPQSLRWEGNYGVLRDFDNHTAASARPALITQYNSGSTLPASPAILSAGAKVVIAAASSVRVVGDMRFDPIKMCWISNLDPEDDEPDPFEEMDADVELELESAGGSRENFGDDEDDDGRGGTITKGLVRNVFGPGGTKGQGMMEGMKRWVSGSSVSATSTTTTNTTSGASSTFNTPNLHRGSSQSFINTTLDLASTPPHLQTNSVSRRIHPMSVTPELLAECQQAEQRHKDQMKAFYGLSGYSVLELKRGSGNGKDDKKERERKERKEEKRLWEIRNLAMRS